VEGLGGWLPSAPFAAWHRLDTPSAVTWFRHDASSFVAGSVSTPRRLATKGQVPGSFIVARTRWGRRRSRIATEHRHCD